MIGVDWGTSSFRAWRLAPDGRVLDRRDDPRGGILSIPAGGFPAALEAAIGPWLAEGESEVLLCGMIGSRQGWQEAPYLACPAGPAEIAAAVVEVPFPRAGARVRLIPGLTASDAEGVPDVMRGEETKLLALMQALPSEGGLACLPGTHSKWARFSGGRIEGFATHMTGEAFSALSGHTILARTTRPGSIVPRAFAAGVRRAQQPGGLLHHLFGTRALHLMGRLPEEEGAPYLSGVLIGHEIRAALEAGPPAAPVQLLAGAMLASLYAEAFGVLGIPIVQHDPDSVIHGLRLVAEALR
jgi:2-dehydro-3-deoxygalactonokinase